VEAKYKFGLEFQKSLVALILQDQSFVKKYRDVLNPSYIENEHLQYLVRVILSYFDKYKQVPSISVVQDIVSSSGLSSNVINALLDIIKEASEKNVKDRDFIIDNVVKFGKTQAVKLALAKAIELLRNEGNLQDIPKLIDKALLVGSSYDCSLDFVDGVLELPNLLKKDSAYTKFPTPWQTINKKMCGGVGPGELVCLIGGTGYGKSVTCVEIAASAALLRVPVLYVTLELREIDVLLRLASRIFDIPVGSLVSNYHSHLEVIRNKLIERNLLRVSYYPVKSIDVNDLRYAINALRSSKGFSPKVIIVDYPRRMKLYGTDMYQALGDIFDDLINLGQENEAIVVAPTQMGRSNYRLSEADMDSVSDSWLQVANADLVLVMRQTIQERKQGIVNYWVAKARRGGDTYNVKCAIDYERCKVIELTENSE